MNWYKQALFCAVMVSSTLIARAQETGKTGDASCPL